MSSISGSGFVPLPDPSELGLDAAADVAGADAPEAEGTIDRSGGTASTTRVRTATASGSSAALLDKTLVGTIPGAKTEVRFDAAKGTFTSNRPGRPPKGGGKAIYNAAKLVAAGETGFLTDSKLGASGRMALARTLERSLAQGGEYQGDKPKSVDIKARSGASTISLAFMKTLPQGDPLRGRLLDAYLTQMSKEPERGLQGSMAINLEHAAKAGDVELSRAQRKTLREAKEAALPSRPPYDEWFKDGKNELNIRTFLHPEFIEEDLAAWKGAGFKIKSRTSRQIILEGTFADPDGKRDPMKATVKLKMTEKKIFRDMDDPNVQIEFYSGHSNLGGNVLGALNDGPSRMNGTKWVVNWMCRGQQVLADVYNRFPDAHYMTTNAPATEHGPELINAMMTGIAGRKSYDWISKEARYQDMWEEDLLIWPNDKEQLEARDDDGDGVVTVAGKQPDALYNVGLRSAPDRVRDLKPARTTMDPNDIAGEKVLRGVNFLNTVLEYHHEHETDGRIPKSVLGDALHANGWFAGDTNDLIQVTERKVGNKTHYDIALNSKFKDQDIDVLSAGMAYEFNRHISKQQGEYTDKDKLRGSIMAGHYLAYMVDTYEESDDIVNALKDKYSLPEKFDWPSLWNAMNTDHDGYATPGQTRDLGRRVGFTNPHRG